MMSSEPLYDIKQLFRDLANGDGDVFKIIFSLYKKKVYGTAFKMMKSEHEAEEIVQEVFLSIWVSREKLGGINDPEAYLFTITYNTIYTYLKKVSTNKRLLSDLIERITEIQNSTEEIIALRETQKLIDKAVEQLPPQQQVIFKLSKQEDLSYEEIANRMGLSKNTVRNHLARAMNTIRSFLRGAAGLWSILF